MGKFYRCFAAAILVALLPLVVGGCSGGGGGEGTAPPTSDAVLEVRPANHDFGTVTPGNLVAPVEVKLTNGGSQDNLNIASLVLSDTGNFSLDTGGGADPCASPPLTLAAGESCTVTVAFDPVGEAVFDESLTIQSDAGTNPTFELSLAGQYEEVATLNLRINQLQACPRPGEITAYVSVTDQANYPVTGLGIADFTVVEDGTTLLDAPSQVTYVETVSSLAVALVLDYSSSVTTDPEVVADMEASAADFIDQLGPGDEAEIVKFDSTVEVVLGLTPGTAGGKALLREAIFAAYDNGENTALYDATYQAVKDIGGSSKDRRAVIVLSDGKLDSSSTVTSVAEVIDFAVAMGVPVFPVGLGDIDQSILERIADGTGGQLYPSPSSETLLNIYRQLSDLLLFDQYILTYPSTLSAAGTAGLQIHTTVDGVTGADTITIPSCP